ncbi:MAG: tripartite tricarboxylate transporter substrate binding protein [Peptococcaceae bacterium]
MIRSKKVFLPITLILIFSLIFLGGCSSQLSKQTEPQGPEKKEEVKQETKQEIKYPEGPVTLHCAFNPGGGVDTMFRTTQAFLEKELDQPVIVKYTSGAGGEIGWNEFSKAKPDGYTITGLITPHIILQPMLRDTIYKTDDFLPIALVSFCPGVVLVPNDSPFKDFQQFLDYAKQNPGKLTVAITGTQSFDHVQTILLNKNLGIELKMVVFATGADAVKAVLGNHVDAFVTNILWTVQQKENLRTLVVLDEQRHQYAPDVPTIKELGYDIKDYSSNVKGFAIHKDTPPEIVSKLQAVFEKIANNPEFQEKMNEAGMGFKYFNTEQALEYINRDVEIHNKIKEDLLKEIK